MKISYSFSSRRENHASHKPTSLFLLNLGLLIAINYFAAYQLIERGINSAQVLFLFAGQGLVLMFINILRILMLRKYKTSNFRINGSSLTPSRETKYLAAKATSIFIVFELFYILFIALAIVAPDGAEISFSLIGQIITVIDWMWLLATIPLFAMHHAISFVPEIIELRARNSKTAPNIGKIVFLPFWRIIPMHLIVIFFPMLMSTSNSQTIFAIMTLKTLIEIPLYIFRVGHAK